MTVTLPDRLQALLDDNNAIYEALPTATSIRSIALHPGGHQTQILCSLSVVELEHVQPFQALSYNWGDEVADESISCNGRPFKVTRNLLAALKKLRSPTETRHMWIDAISINQSSIPERNQQVPLMVQIYQKASRVTVWLGEVDDSTSLAQETMQSICEACYELAHDTDLAGQSPVDFSRWLLGLAVDDKAWNTLRSGLVTRAIPRWPRKPSICDKALKRFFSRPWFSRVWVIQEDRIFALLRHPACSPDAVAIQSSTHLGLNVDYATSLPELYRQIALRSIESTDSLQILSYANEDTSKRATYPTWMPVWHTVSSRFIGPRRTFLYNAGAGLSPELIRGDNISRIMLGGIVCGRVTATGINLLVQPTERRLKSDGDEPRLSPAIIYPALRQRLDADITCREKLEELSHLLVRGCWQPKHNWHQDTICRSRDNADLHFADFCAFVTERLHAVTSHISLGAKWCSTCRSARHISSPAEEDIGMWYCESCPDFDMCRQCRHNGRHCPGQHQLLPRSLPGMLCQFTSEERAILEANAVSSGDAQRFDLSVRQSFDQQLFFELDSGHIGIGSQAMVPGDLVVIFFGARVPFVLKQQADYYTLAGECYVEGLMDGEAVEAWRRGDMSSQSFVLA